MNLNFINNFVVKTRRGSMKYLGEGSKRGLKDVRIKVEERGNLPITPLDLPYPTD